MKAVIQRVTSASVHVDGEEIGSCGHGLLVLLGVATGDTEEDLERMLQKMVKLRIFEDENGKMNRSIMDVGGEALVVSNFTLLANYSHGNRPEFLSAAAPSVAQPLYEYFCERIGESVGHVGRGVFGADMAVEILGDGPVTIVMDSRVLIK